MVDHKGAVADGHVGHHAELNLIAIRRGKQDAGDLVGGTAEFGGVANGEVEAAVVVDDLGDRGAADGSLHHVVDVLGLKAVARRLRAVDGNQQARLAGDVEYTDVSDTWHFLHDSGDLSGDAREFVEVVAEELE